MTSERCRQLARRLLLDWWSARSVTVIASNGEWGMAADSNRDGLDLVIYQDELAFVLN